MAFVAIGPGYGRVDDATSINFANPNVTYVRETADIRKGCERTSPGSVTKVTAVVTGSSLQLAQR